MSFVFKSAIDAMMRGDLSISGEAAVHLVSRSPLARVDMPVRVAMSATVDAHMEMGRTSVRRRRFVSPCRADRADRPDRPIRLKRAAS